MINYKEKYLKYKKKYLNLKKKLGGSNVDDINLNLEDNYLNKKKLVLANKIALIAYDILKDYYIISKINDLFDSLDQEIKVDFSIKEKKIELIGNIDKFKQLNIDLPEIIPDTILLIKEIIESSHTKIDLKNKIFEWLKKYYSKNSLVNIANKLVIKNVFLLEDNNINKKKLVLANEIAIIAHDILIDDAKISEKINDFYNSLNQEIKDNFLIEKKKCELIGNIDKFKQLNIDLPEIIPDTILLIKEIIESSYTNIDLKNEKIIAWLKKHSIQDFELLLEKEQAETAAEAETKDKLFLEVRKRKGIEIPEAYKELEKKNQEPYYVKTMIKQINESLGFQQQKVLIQAVNGDIKSYFTSGKRNNTPTYGKQAEAHFAKMFLEGKFEAPEFNDHILYQSPSAPYEIKDLEQGKKIESAMCDFLLEDEEGLKILEIKSRIPYPGDSFDDNWYIEVNPKAIKGMQEGLFPSGYIFIASLNEMLKENISEYAVANINDTKLEVIETRNGRTLIKINKKNVYPLR